MSTHCERARQWVSAELDGRLSEFEQALLDGHLKGCAACSTFRATAHRFTDELRSAPLEHLERPVAVSRARRRVSFRLAPAVAALAVTAVGLGSILASSVVRPGSAVNQPSQAPDTAQRLTPAQGPVNLSAVRGLNRAQIVAAATSVDTSQPQRAPSGGTVLR